MNQLGTFMKIFIYNQGAHIILQALMKCIFHRSILKCVLQGMSWQDKDHSPVMYVQDIDAYTAMYVKANIPRVYHTPMHIQG